MRKLCLLFALMALPCWAQEPADSIELGAKLKLGMSQQEVLKEISKKYEAKELSEPGHYVVYTKPPVGEKPRWEGLLTFKDGRLASAERLWAYQNDENSVALTKSLVGVFSSMIKDGRNTCTIESVISDAPDAQGETIFLNCGKRSLKISVAKVEGYKEDAAVSEILEK